MMGLESRMFFSSAIGARSGDDRTDFASQICVFLPSTPNPTVLASLEKLNKDKQRLTRDLASLSHAQRATLQADEQAIRAAVDVHKSIVMPLQNRLRSNLNVWRKKIAQAGEQEDNELKASGLAAIAADRAAIDAIIDADVRVISARAQLSAHLPSIAADQATIKADTAALVADMLAELTSLI